MSYLILQFEFTMMVFHILVGLINELCCLLLYCGNKFQNEGRMYPGYINTDIGKYIHKKIQISTNCLEPNSS